MEINMINDDIAFLIDCDNAYYNGEEPLVSDIEYDRRKSKAREMYPNDPYFQTVGATPEGDNKVDLPYVLGSQEKRKFDGSLNAWLADNGICKIAAGDKLDGCSIYVEYEGGEVQFASTRGNGYVGQDITEKAKLFCPKSSFIGSFHVRGEALALTSIARGLGYKKSRSFVSGVLNSDGVENVEFLHVVFYLVLDRDYDTYEKHIETIKSFGLPAVNYSTFDVVFLMNRGFNIEEILAEHYKARKEVSEWDIDGLVCVDNDNPNHQDDYYPSNSVAFKVNEDAVEAVVTGIEWEVKRTGKIQPVVHFEPIDISGSTVTKATGFNFDFIRTNEIGKGAKVGVVLSGEIIPYITDVFENSAYSISEIPQECPSCGNELSLSSTGIDLYCTNSSCIGRLHYQMENFLLAHGVEEMSITTIRKLGIRSWPELLDLDEFSISMKDGFGASRASTISTQLEKVFRTTPANLLKSFGITGCGETMSKMIINHFEGDFDRIFHANIYEFQSIEGIGKIMSETLKRELPNSYDLYHMLKERGLKFDEMAGDILKGKKVTLTGKSEISRNELTKIIESQGGMVKGISKGVDYLFTNSPESTSNKMKKAKEFGVTILPYEDLYKMLNLKVGI